MSRFREWRYRKFHEAVEYYGESLASEHVVNEKETARCHAAKLVYEVDGEKRLRSIQSLVKVRDLAGIGPLIRDLTEASTIWPAGIEANGLLEKRSFFLACALRDLLKEVDEANISLV